MTDTPSGLPPAGWYPDPYGAPHERWWDGAQWTEHTTTPVVEEPVQPTDEAPVEPVQPIVAEPVTEQPLFEQPVYEQPSYAPGGFGEQPTHEEPAYEEPEYEQTYEATQQQPSPSWASPVSAAAASPATSFDDLFGSTPATTEAESEPEPEPWKPALTTPGLVTPEEAPTSGPRTTDPAFESLFGGGPRVEEPAVTAEPAWAFDPTPAAQPAAEPFDGLPASSQTTGQQAYAQPAADDGAFDFGRIVAGGTTAAVATSAAQGAESDPFSNWSNDEYVDPPRNTAATGSVVFGVLSFVIPGVAGLVGLILGVIGVLRANGFKADGDGPVGRTKSLIGIGLSVIGSIVSIALVLVVLPGIINPDVSASTSGSTTEDGSSIVAAAPATANGGIALAEGDLATITFPGTADPSIQFSVTGITVNPTCTEDPELVLSPDNGQFIAITMTFTTAADYASQMSTGGLLLVSPTDFSGYLPDGTSVLSSDAGISCIPEAEQLPDGIPAGGSVTATMILDLSEAATSITYSPVGVTDLDTTQTFWEWPIPR